MGSRKYIEFATIVVALGLSLVHVGCSSSDSSCSDTTITPAGPKPKQCVHEVPDGAVPSTDAAGDTVVAVDGKVVATYPPCHCGAATGGSSNTTRLLVAQIQESASTNASSIAVAVYTDGSAQRALGATPLSGHTSFDPSPESFPAGTPEVVAFLADLALVGDVSSIQTNNCSKSVSFGTRTTITANGKTSGDLQCALNPSAAQQALIQDCGPLL